jgi:hypothetical protein
MALSKEVQKAIASVRFSTLPCLRIGELKILDGSITIKVLLVDYFVGVVLFRVWFVRGGLGRLQYQKTEQESWRKNEMFHVFPRDT